MDKRNTCCITGHRNIPVSKLTYVKEALTQEIIIAIKNGYTHFISGFASGADLIFSEIIADLKSKHDITLEAAIPYSGRMNTPDTDFQALIKDCDIIKIHSDKYSKSCYMVRNRYMVDCSELIIAVYDGRQSGGTAATIRYARTLGKTVCIINI